jgi:pimeloyl-ACP methyl ester carboxylesterase
VTQVRKRSAVASIMPATVNVRRSYADSRYGQLHVATAYPSGGGFDERTALICLHQAGGSNRAFAPLLPELGRERSVYAIDLPGHGSSDVAPGAPTIADYAAAIGDFVTSLRLRTFDLFGVEAGALIAAEIAASRGPQVRRAVLLSIPYSMQAMRTIAPREAVGDASANVAEDWQRFAAARGPNVSMAAVQAAFADHLRSGSSGNTLRAAVQDYPVSQRLPLMRLPTLVLCPHDELREQTLRAKSCLAQGSLVELAEYGNNALAAAPLKIAQLTKDFLDR